jgi:hypothetical protein
MHREGKQMPIHQLINQLINQSINQSGQNIKAKGVVLELAA